MKHNARKPSAPAEPGKKSRSSGKVWLWILTVFLALSFLVYFPHLTAWLMLAAAILVAPPLKIRLPAFLKTVLVVLLIVGGSFCAPDQEPQRPERLPAATEAAAAVPTTVPTTEATEPPTETTVPTEPPVETTEPVETTLPVETAAPTEAQTLAPGVTDEDGYFILDPSVTEAVETVPETQSVPLFTESPIENVGQNYVVNVNTGKFHYPDCASARRIKPENRWDFFGSRDDLIRQGYKPCGKCFP